MKGLFVAAFVLVFVFISVGPSFAEPYVGSSFPGDNLIIAQFISGIGAKQPNLAIIGKYKDKDNVWIIFFTMNNVNAIAYKLIRTDTNYWVLETIAGNRILQK
jgi:hypothetical protein